MATLSGGRRATPRSSTRRWLGGYSRRAMARRLIIIPRAHARIVGAERIDGRYPRPYTEAEMRQWAADLERVYATPTAELDRLRGLPREDLTSDQRALVE